MLKPGRYVAENNDNWIDRYRIVMEVKETEKSYCFKMVECDNRYGYDHIKMMFDGKERKTIRKDKPCSHAMLVWGDKNFTIYPFRAGIPFYFRLEETSRKYQSM